ncbi:hypothetical protein NMY22_g14514 [Coprinellus aureogranulatus]|nr:hypothetical protein NMY22_g14514 [Coprinellus aureogranulatus]
MSTPKYAKHLALSLSRAAFRVHSRHAVLIDDLVVHALFAPCNEGGHIPQTMGITFPIPPEALLSLYRLFEREKGRLRLSQPTVLLATAKSIVTTLKRDRSTRFFRELKDEQFRVFEWCLAAYSMLIDPQSRLRLRAIRMGPDRAFGFGLFARQPIPANTELWEGLGVMPYDNSTPTTNLSLITVADGQDQRPGLARILYGPMRMVNHLCRTYNSEYVFHRDTSMFILVTVRDVDTDEEVTVNYGSKWFAGNCPCSDCVQHANPTDNAVPPQPLHDPLFSPSTAVIHKRNDILQQSKAERARNFVENRKLANEGHRIDARDAKRLKQLRRRQLARASTATPQ